MTRTRSQGPGRVTVRVRQLRPPNRCCRPSAAPGRPQLLKYFFQLFPTYFQVPTGHGRGRKSRFPKPKTLKCVRIWIKLETGWRIKIQIIPSGTFNVVPSAARAGKGAGRQAPRCGPLLATRRPTRSPCAAATAPHRSGAIGRSRIGCQTYDHHNLTQEYVIP